MVDVLQPVGSASSTELDITPMSMISTPLTEDRPSTSVSNQSIQGEISTIHRESSLHTTLSRIPSSQYGDVPLDEFELQVQMLCHLLWPTSVAESDESLAKRKRKRFLKALRKRDAVVPQAVRQPRYFVIEHMRGGGYNRLAAIKMIDQSGVIESEMVLRVPRMGVPQSDQDVINLQFVREYLTDVPIPEILAYDHSDSNPTDKPYMIQKRIPGYDLESKIQPYTSLNHQQKLIFVQDFCQILLNIRKIQHPWIGQIKKAHNELTISPFDVFPETETLIAQRAEIIPFFKPRPFTVTNDEEEEEEATPDSATDATDIADSQTPLHFFRVQFARWRTLELGLDPTDLWLPSIWQRLTTATAEMWEAGCLDYDNYCLMHCDLDPRNIIVEIQEDNTPKITGIIDWDIACFAPDWVGCKPPIWIWNWLDGGSEDEAKVNEPLPSPEQQELKDLFDKTVGPLYTYNAYEPHYRLARELFKYARFGLRRADWREEAEKVLEEWDEVVLPAFRKKMEEFEREYAEKDGDGKSVDGGDEESTRDDTENLD